MEDAFDPYRKWLGIPPEEQPPNHYRLLGIALFEDDPDVISNAADRQMAHVRTFQTGKRAVLSQGLLNELSAAKICLLDPTRKTVYDRDLAALQARLPRAVASPAATPLSAMPSSAASPSGRPAPLPVAAPIAAARPAPTNGQSRESTATATAPIAINRRVSRPRAVRRSSPSAAISVAAGLALLIVVVISAAFYLSGQRGANGDGDRAGQRSTKKSRADSSDKATSPPSSDDGVGVPIAKSTAGDGRTIRPRRDDASSPPPDEKQDEPPAPSDDDPPGDSPPADDSSTTTTDDKTPPGEAPPRDDEDAPPPAVAKRPPAPSPAAIDKAYRIVRKEFEPQLRQAIEPAERFEIAQQIVERAAAADEPATKYALYLLARNLGVQMASAEQVCDVVDLLATRFDVDPFEMKRESLQEISQFVTLEAEDFAHLLRIVQRLARQALAVENGEAALELTRLSRATSLKVRTPKALKELPRLEDLLADVDRLFADVAEYDREVKGFDRSSRLLEKDADDAGANLSIGRYWLLVKGNWRRALPHLAKGVDPSWKDPATIDLAGPQTPADRVALADAWYALALRKGGLAAPLLLGRAKFWYSRAVESAAEADKPAIAAKIADVDKQLDALQPPPDPTATDTAQPSDEASADTTPTENGKPASPAADATAPGDGTSGDGTADDDGPAFPD